MRLAKQMSQYPLSNVLTNCNFPSLTTLLFSWFFASQRMNTIFSSLEPTTKAYSFSQVFTSFSSPPLSFELHLSPLCQWYYKGGKNDIQKIAKIKKKKISWYIEIYITFIFIYMCKNHLHILHIYIYITRYFTLFIDISMMQFCDNTFNLSIANTENLLK